MTADESNSLKRSRESNASGPQKKWSKGGSGGRWQTAHQAEKKTLRVKMGRELAIGDQGMWVTHARGMKTKAIKEFISLCEETCKEMYGISLGHDEEFGKDENVETDIATSITNELESFKKPQRPSGGDFLTPVAVSLDSLFFLKTMAPIDPLNLALRMSKDARACQDLMQRKCKYVNRLTPVLNMEKATLSGMDQVARQVLAPWFDLIPSEDTGQEGKETTLSNHPAHTYGIRYNIRNHETFTSTEVIERIANMIGPKHKVNLSKPEKVILVEIYQLFCGMSVIDGIQWEELKRYNLNELYKLGADAGASE